jgi:hypothetical protein
MHDCSLVFVASTTFVIVTLHPLKVLAARCVEKGNRNFENILEILRCRCDTWQVAKEMRSNRGVCDEPRVVHNFGRELGDLRMHPMLD